MGGQGTPPPSLFRNWDLRSPTRKPGACTTMRSVRPVISSGGARKGSKACPQQAQPKKDSLMSRRRTAHLQKIQAFTTHVMPALRHSHRAQGLQACGLGANGVPLRQVARSLLITSCQVNLLTSDDERADTLALMVIRIPTHTPRPGLAKTG